MNIKRAKNEIKNALKAYLATDEFGAYRIPPIRQRPILLMGPPGIGKTQIMQQIAEETGVGLVSYTLTHHTRQSALGLPFIDKVVLGGEERTVTAYTMSEIIASVYREMERTGVKEGILFLDEINCISETLTPMMLQFLQCKTFGNQQLPAGWVVVAAGNPPEYNKSVREFDVVTLDRVKKIDIEEDFGVWKEYAYRRGIHGAILSYLEIRREHFYRVETTADGLQFVTARGWEDLSELMQVYESLGIPVDLPTALLLSVVASLCACGASGVAGGSLLLIPLACNMFGISNDIAMQVVAVGFIIGVLQDSCETALNSSTDVLFTAAACQAEDDRLANSALRN